MLLLFHTEHREESTQVFPLLARPSWYPVMLGSKETVPHCSSFTFPSRTSWLSGVAWLFALLCQDPDPSVQMLEPLAGKMPHCILGGRMK